MRIASVDGSGGFTVAVEGGQEISGEDISFDSTETDMLWRTVSGLRDISVSDANMIINGMSVSNASGDIYLSTAHALYTSGYYNIPVDKQYSGKIRPELETMIYKAGQRAAGAVVAKQQASVQAAADAKVRKTGGVYYGYDGNTMEDRKKSGKKLSKMQAVAVDFAQRLAGSRGITFYFYESYLDENGNRVYKDRNGKIVKAENGFYSSKDGTIHIDLNAGSYGRGSVLFTIAHELTHFIQDWSPKHYKKLCNILMKGYAAKGQSVEELVTNQQAYAKEHGRELTREEAYDEVIADSMESILADGKVMELMRDIEATDKSLADKVKKFFQNIGNLLKRTIQAYSHVKPDSEEGRMVQGMQEICDQLQQVFAEGLYEGGDNYRKAEKNTTAEGGEIKYMSREIKDVTENTVRKDLTEVFNGVNVSAKSYIPLLKSTPFAVRYITGYKNDLPIIVEKKKSYFDMREDGKFKEDSSHHYHGMGVDGFIEALRILEDPECAILEHMGDGRYHYAFISTSESAEEICIALQMSVSKSKEQMNGYPGGYYNLDITEFVATDEWLEAHGVEPGTSYKDYLLSFSENTLVYDKSIHFEQMEKARSADSGSAGLAASHINNRASEERVPQNNPGVKENDSAKSDGIKQSVRKGENDAAQAILEQENAQLKENIAHLKELLKLQRTITNGTKFTKISVEAAARMLKQNANAKGDTAELTNLLHSFYEHIATCKELSWESVKERAQPVVDWLQDHVNIKPQRSEYAQDILSQLHGSRIYLDDTQKAEAAHRFGSFEAYRRSMMGSVVIAKDANTSLDSLWQELSAVYPDVFDLDNKKQVIGNNCLFLFLCS